MDEVRKHARANPNKMDVTDAKGNTPLHLYLKFENRIFAGPLQFLIGDGSPLHSRNLSGEFPLDIALKRDFSVEALLLREADAPMGRSKVLREKLAFLESHADFFTSGRRSAADAALEGFNQLDSKERQIFSEALRAFVAPERESWLVPQDPRRRLSPEAPKTELARLLPNLIVSPSASLLYHLTKVVDHFAAPKKSAFHPNESEFLAMLAYPTLLAKGGEDLHAVVFGLTSLRRFDLQGVKSVDDEVLHLWADIGSAGFEFLNLKFDARRFIGSDRSPTTLLERYGFTRVELRSLTPSGPFASVARKRGQQRRSVFVLNGEQKPDAARIRRVRAKDGDQRLVTRIDPRTELELGQPFVRLYHPDHGEYIFRNSAPDGGRDTLLHPAYILSADRRKIAAGPHASPGLEHQWSPAQIERIFSEVLSPSLYPNGHLGRDLQSVRFLLNQYRTFMRDYRAWMCDLSESTAYLEDATTGERYLMGAYRSPGFQTLLRAVSHWSSTGTPVELAVCRRDFPAWTEYDRIQVTPEVVDELWKLSSEIFDSPTLRSSGVHTFIQTALNSFGDLIIRSGEPRTL